MPHCFMPFAVLKSKLYLPFLWTTKAPVFLFFGSWPLWGKFAKALLKAPKEKTEPVKSEVQDATPKGGDSPVAQEDDKKTQ